MSTENCPQISQINADFQNSNLRKSGPGESADKNSPVISP
jgi:hypothetical protein